MVVVLEIGKGMLDFPGAGQTPSTRVCNKGLSEMLGADMS